MVENLKHGDLNVKLQVCNDTFVNAAMKFEIDTDILIQEALGSRGVSAGIFIVKYYLYHAYRVHCNLNNNPVAYSRQQFNDELEKKAENSNLESVLEAITNSIVSKLTENIKEGLKEVEGESKKKESKP